MNKNNSKMEEECYMIRKLSEIDSVLLTLMTNVQGSSSNNYKFAINNVILKLQEINDKCNRILNCYEMKVNKNQDNAIDKSLWNNDFISEYLFSDFIIYVRSNKTFVNDLCCIVCHKTFKCRSSELLKHINCDEHLTNFNDYKIKYDESVWRNNYRLKHAFKKFITYKYDESPFHCTICNSDIPYTTLHLVKHLNGEGHLSKFKKLFDLPHNECVLQITESNCNEKLQLKSLVNKKDCYSAPSLKADLNFGMGAVPKVMSSTNTDRSINMANSFKVLSSLEISTINNFMNEAIVKNLKGIKYYCQVCLKYDNNSSFENIDGHEKTALHRGNIEIRNNSCAAFKWQHCNLCNIHFYCSYKLFNFHKKMNQHKTIIFQLKSVVKPLSCTDLSRLNDYNFLDVLASSTRTSSLMNGTEVKKYGIKENINKSESNVLNRQAYLPVVNSYSLKPLTYSRSMTSLLSNASSAKSNNTYDDYDNISICSRDSGASNYSGKNELAKRINKLIYLIERNIIQINNRKSNILGFYCKYCDFWGKDYMTTSIHLKTKRHRFGYSLNVNNFKNLVCDCTIRIISDDQFHQEHKESVEHKDLNLLVKNHLLNYRKSDGHLTDNGSGFNENLCRSNKDIKKKETDLGSFRCFQYNENIGKINKKEFWFGLKDLPSSTTEDCVRSGCSVIGEVEHIEFIDSHLCNVKVKLRDGLEDLEKSVSYSGVTVNINGVKYVVREKFTSNACVTENICLTEVKHNFIENRQTFFDELYHSWKIEMSETICFFNKNVMVTSLLENDIKIDLPNLPYLINSDGKGVGYTNPELYDMTERCVEVFVESDSQTQNVFYVKNMLNMKPEKYEIISCNGRYLCVIHKLTKLKCFILYGKGLAMERTRLLSMYLHCDERIIKLVLIIKELFKQINLDYITLGDAITWMVLYFLMQPYIALLNPVVNLKKCFRGDLKSQYGWDYGFCVKSSAPVLLKGGCKLSVDELLSEFVKFYQVMLDVETDNGEQGYIHCPLVGEKFDKNQFDKLNLPIAFDKYINRCKNNSIIKLNGNGYCVQDPLSLNKNLTENLHISDLKKVQFVCTEMVKLFQK